MKLMKLAHPTTGQLLYTFVIIGHAEQKEVNTLPSLVEILGSIIG